MTWRTLLLVSVVSVCLSCSRKHVEQMQTDVTLAHWEKQHDQWRGYEILEDSIWLMPCAPLWGDSMTIPPCPPAPSFHYVWLSPSVVAPDLSKFPVYARRMVRRYGGDSLGVAQTNTEEHRKTTEKKVTPSGSHWWVYVLVFLFVDVLCLFVYFIWRFKKKSLPL